MRDSPTKWVCFNLLHHRHLEPYKSKAQAPFKSSEQTMETSRWQTSGYVRRTQRLFRASDHTCRSCVIQQWAQSKREVRHLKCVQPKINFITSRLGMWLRLQSLPSMCKTPSLILRTEKRVGKIMRYYTSGCSDLFAAQHWANSRIHMVFKH